MIRAIKDLPYEDRLRSLDLPTLVYRRSRGDMVLTFKIFKGYIDIDPNIFFKLNDNMTRARGTSLIVNSVQDFFRTKGFTRIFDGFFLKNKGIFAKGVRDFLGVKCPSDKRTSPKNIQEEIKHRNSQNFLFVKSY